MRHATGSQAGQDLVKLGFSDPECVVQPGKVFSRLEIENGPIARSWYGSSE
jgi:hypothetical protein